MARSKARRRSSVAARRTLLKAAADTDTRPTERSVIMASVKMASIRLKPFEVWPRHGDVAEAPWVGELMIIREVVSCSFTGVPS